MTSLARDLTYEQVSKVFAYTPETGRLVRISGGRGRKLGALVGHIENGHRRCWFAGQNRATAHLVWILNKGQPPGGFLTHINGDNTDDRIENLEVIKKPLRIEFITAGKTESQYGRLPARNISGVYEIRCLANGRRYIGSAICMDKRWRLHYTQLSQHRHHSRHLQRAWNKYGEEMFVFRVLEECDKQFLLAREQHYIDTMKPEFNSRPNAASQLGWKPSEEVRARMRAARRKDFSPMKGRRHSEETRAKISRSKTGVKFGPHSEERKARIREGKIRAGRIITIEKAREVKRLKSLGMSHKEVSLITGIGYWTVADVARGRTFTGLI